MTSYQEVREMVAGSTPPDWIPFQDIGTWTYQPDVALRISREQQIDSRYQPPWTHQIQGSNARYGYYVYYEGSPVEYHVIVGVDEGRAFVPEPRQQPDGTYSISEYEATLGRIVTGDPETFRAYLNRTGIGIR